TYETPALTRLTRSRSTSTPETVNPARPRAAASERPTYPSPTMTTCACLVRSLSMSRSENSVVILRMGDRFIGLRSDVPPVVMVVLPRKDRCGKLVDHHTEHARSSAFQKRPRALEIAAPGSSGLRNDDDRVDRRRQEEIVGHEQDGRTITDDQLGLLADVVDELLQPVGGEHTSRLWLETAATPGDPHPAAHRGARRGGLAGGL